MSDKRVIDMTANELAEYLADRIHMKFTVIKDRKQTCNSESTELEEELKKVKASTFGINVAGYYEGFLIPAVSKVQDITFIVYPLPANDKQFVVKRYDKNGKLFTVGKYEGNVVLPLVGARNQALETKLKNFAEEIKEIANSDTDFHRQPTTSCQSNSNRGMIAHNKRMAEFMADTVEEWRKDSVDNLVFYAKSDAENTFKLHKEQLKQETLNKLIDKAWDIDNFTYILVKYPDAILYKLVLLDKASKTNIILMIDKFTTERILGNITEEGLYTSPTVTLKTSEGRELTPYEQVLSETNITTFSVTSHSKTQRVNVTFRVGDHYVVVKPLIDTPNVFSILKFFGSDEQIYVISEEELPSAVVFLWGMRSDAPVKKSISTGIGGFEPMGCKTSPVSNFDSVDIKFFPDYKVLGSTTGRVQTDKPNQENTPKPGMDIKRFDKIRWKHEGKYITSIVQYISTSELDLGNDDIIFYRHDTCDSILWSVQKTLAKVTDERKKQNIYLQLNRSLTLFRKGTILLLVDCDDVGTRRKVLLDKLMRNGIEVANSDGEFERKLEDEWEEVTNHLKHTKFKLNGTVFVIAGCSSQHSDVFHVTSYTGPEGTDQYDYWMPQEALLAMIGKNKVFPRITPSAPRRDYQYFQIIDKKIQYGPKVTAKKSINN